MFLLKEISTRNRLWEFTACSSSSLLSLLCVSDEDIIAQFLAPEAYAMSTIWTDTCACAQTHIHTHTHTVSHIHTHTDAHVHTHTLTHALTHTLTYTLFLTHTYNTLIHMYMNTHTYTQAVTPMCQALC